MMSDGSLSQDEIDALLFQGGSDTTEEIPMAPSITNSDKDRVLSLIDHAKDGMGKTLSGMLGRTTTIRLGNSSVTDRKNVLLSMNDEIVEIKLDYTGEAPGDHLFLASKKDAIKIAGLMSGQDGIELDAMALASIGEAISQITGTFLTSVEREIRKNISPSSPEAQGIPKNMVRFPDGDFVAVELILNIDGEGTVTLNEYFDSSIVSAMSSVQPSAPANNQSQQNMYNNPPQQSNQQSYNGMNQQYQQPMMNNQMQQPMMGGNMYNQMQQPMMGGNMYNQMQQPMMGMPMYQQQNVQGVQYPNLNHVDLSGVDSRNIGLLMDVSMELTVELGRTKWQIKDILGIGKEQLLSWINWQVSLLIF